MPKRSKEVTPFGESDARVLLCRGEVSRLVHDHDCVAILNEVTIRVSEFEKFFKDIVKTTVGKQLELGTYDFVKISRKEIRILSAKWAAEVRRSLIEHKPPLCANSRRVKATKPKCKKKKQASDLFTINKHGNTVLCYIETLETCRARFIYAFSKVL